MYEESELNTYKFIKELELPIQAANTIVDEVKDNDKNKRMNNLQ